MTNRSQETHTDAKPDTHWFTEARFGMFIHWGTYAAAARHEWVRSHEKMPLELYLQYFLHFYPDLYDPAEWARYAAQAGMKYVVVTAKHHEGFCLWDSQYTDYKATRTPWGKDLLRPLVDAFRQAGLRIGFYYSLLDWHHPHFTVDRFHPQRDDTAERAKNQQRDMRVYAEYMRNQVRELLTQFGRIDLMWYDFSYPGEDGKGRDDWQSEKLYALTRELQPHILINNRLDLPDAGDFVTPEQVQPAGPITDDHDRPVVWEACHTFSGSWGYYRDEYTWKSVRQLLWMLIDAVSKNGNLLLNVGPTARGEFDPRAQERLQGIAKWMKHHNRSIYGCGAAPPEFPCPPDCRLTYNATSRRLYLHVLNWPIKYLRLEGDAYVQRIAYAQFLHDASEVPRKAPAAWQDPQLARSARHALYLELPIVQPPVEIPVIELFLK